MIGNLVVEIEIEINDEIKADTRRPSGSSAGEPSAVGSIESRAGGLRDLLRSALRHRHWLSARAIVVHLERRGAEVRFRESSSGPFIVWTGVSLGFGFGACEQGLHGAVLLPRTTRRWVALTRTAPGIAD